MKRLVVVGGFIAAFVAAAAVIDAQTPAAGQRARGGRAATTKQGEEGHTAPKPQPATAPDPTVPTGEVVLGTVRIPKAVKADGKPLPPGTYQVRVTPQPAAPQAKGQTPTAERWAEFVQRGQVKGREVVTIVPRSEVTQVQKDTPPPPNRAKVETLRGGEYMRVWFNKDGNHYLVHLPTA